MKKLNELTADELFDFIYALTPVLPDIINTGVVQWHLLKKYPDNVNKIRLQYLVESKKEDNEQKINELLLKIEQEQRKLLANDSNIIIPVLIKPENRNSVFGALAILEGTTVENLKKYPGTKVTAMINQLIKDVNFQDFLAQADPPELTS